MISRIKKSSKNNKRKLTKIKSKSKSKSKTKSKSKSKSKLKSKSKSKSKSKTTLKKPKNNKIHINKDVIDELNVLKYNNGNNSNKSPFVYAFDSLITELEKLKNLDYIVSNFNKEFSPLSGSEPDYEPHKWNNNPRIKDTHNCYSYAIDQIVSNRSGKPQPGYFAHFKNISNKEYKDCRHFYKRLKKDTPTMYLSSFDGKCRKGYSKAFIALANKTYHTDYHFYRQDSNKYWSHKPGRTDVVNVDASKKLIKNPYIANRDYKHLNYSKPCFFFCRPKKLSKTSSISIN